MLLHTELKVLEARAFRSLGGGPAHVWHSERCSPVIEVVPARRAPVTWSGTRDAVREVLRMVQGGARAVAA